MSNPKAEETSWMPAIAAMLAMVLISMDLFMTPIATTALSEEFGTNAGMVQTAIALFSLIFAALTILGGKLGDIYGKKKIFITGLWVYAVAAVITTFSPSMTVMLLGFTFVRSVAVALMIPASVALIVANYEDEGRRGQAFSIYGMGGMVAGLLAPTFMGFMAEHVSWRVPYGIEIPIILVAIILARRMRETPTVKTSVDAPGTVLTFLAIGAIVMSGMLGARYGWWDARRPFEIFGVGFNPLDLAPTAILLIAAVVLLAILVAHVRRREDRGQPALFRMSLFDNHTYLVSFVLCAVFFLLNGALPFVVPVFLQEGVQFDASQAGMVMTVFMVGALFGSLASGPLVARIQPRTLMQLALAVVGVGFFALYATSSTTMGFVSAAMPMFIVGFGFGIVVAQAPNVQLSTVAPELQGEASGLAETSKEVGVGLGTAVIGSILFSLALGNMVDGVAQQAEVDLTMKERSELILQVEDKVVPEDVKKLVDETVPDLEEVIKEAYLKAFKSTLGVLVAVVLLAFLIASFIPRVGKEAMEKVKPHTAAVSSVGG